MNEYIENSYKFIAAIKSLGFDFQDCPVCTIKPAWESFPIVKAIRQAEKISGVKYSDLYG